MIHPSRYARQAIKQSARVTAIDVIEEIEEWLRDPELRDEVGTIDEMIGSNIDNNYDMARDDADSDELLTCPWIAMLAAGSNPDQDLERLFYRQTRFAIFARRVEEARAA